MLVHIQFIEYRECIWMQRVGIWRNTQQSFIGKSQRAILPLLSSVVNDKIILVYRLFESIRLTIEICHILLFEKYETVS